MEALIDEIAVGTVFLTTPDGPRAALTPLLSTGDGAVQFHLARGNALTRHLDGATALVTINGPDGYVSPRWYANRDTVPTWDYVALELEGRVRPMADEGLEGFLHTLIQKHEGRLGDAPWRTEEASGDMWARLLRGIAGFEMEVLAWRPTIKLSQKKSPRNAGIAAGLKPRARKDSPSDAEAGNDQWSSSLRRHAVDSRLHLLQMDPPSPPQAAARIAPRSAASSVSLPQACSKWRPMCPRTRQHAPKPQAISAQRAARARGPALPRHAALLHRIHAPDAR